MTDATGPRRAEAQDADTIVEILTSAFYRDPTWAWAFPDPDLRADQHRRLWRLFVAGGLRYSWVWLGAGHNATSVWIPPNGTELSADQEVAFEEAVLDMLGADAPRVMALLERFEQAHPRNEPHYYLSLLGTHANHRGHGLGLRLLADNLAVIDAEGMPAYLEASNPVNVALYGRHGFTVHGSFQPAADAPEVFTMWRDARPVRGTR